MNEKEIADFEQKLTRKPEYDNNLVQTMKMKRILNNSFYKTKYNLKTDVSTKVMERLKKSRSILNGIINLFAYFFRQNS